MPHREEKRDDKDGEWHEERSLKGDVLNSDFLNYSSLLNSSRSRFWKPIDSLCFPLAFDFHFISFDVCSS